MHVIKTSHTNLQCTKMAGEKRVYGGYDCEFVGAVSDRLNCNICTKVLRDPHLTVCCGQHFCESCLNKWFTRQGKESCPHCRAEGEFNHVIHKGLRSEVNQLKIRCSNHGVGCQWTGELGELKHLESDNGCGFVMVECPRKCSSFVPNLAFQVTMVKRNDMQEHLTQSCYLRPYQCVFCGLKDTYEAITGWGLVFPIVDENGYAGHRAECPEAPLTCPNKCGADRIKRKNMESHRSQCPQEPVECPFAEAGCKVEVRRQQLEDHMTTGLQQHVMLLMIDRKQLKEGLDEVKVELNKVENERDEVKRELREVKAKLGKAETERDEIKAKLHETEDRLALCEVISNPANKLKSRGDSMEVTMPRFSEYRHSGKVWHSPPFYYEGYKICLAVHANGVGEGAGTHISVAILHLRGEFDGLLKWPMKCYDDHYKFLKRDGCWHFRVCRSNRYPALNEHVLDSRDKFCSLHVNEKVLHMVNDCLNICVKHNGCYLIVTIQ